MAYLSNVKVGDKVLECSGSWTTHLRIATVAKVGKLHIVLDNTVKYNKHGKRAGDRSYLSSYIKPYDLQEWQQYVEEENERRMRSALASTNWMNIDKSVVQAAYAVLPKRQNQ